MGKILVTGAYGQIGSELVPALRKRYGKENVVSTGRGADPINSMCRDGPCEVLDVMDRVAIGRIITAHNVDTIYHLAAILSAVGEKNPQLAYSVNMNGFYNILEAGREHKLKQIMVPSSIAAFGPTTPREGTPNETIMRPTTMYGITKVAGELLGNYYFQKFGLDVRGVRFPGIISHAALPGGGTTDYAVAIYYEAIQKGSYECFVREDTVLPMMYMPDALKALIDLSEADIKKLGHHTDYNVAAMSFSVKELAASIKKHMPNFKVSYKPDFRQAIADSWPSSLDDSAARKEWGWKPEYDLEKMTKDMLEKLGEKLKAKK